jgi:peptidoglycan LD-endopeptidase LytH
MTLLPRRSLLYSIAWTSLTVARIAAVAAAAAEASLGGQGHVPIPEDFLGSFGAYPNLVRVTDEDRQTFHPVLKFPRDITVPVVDYRQAKGLASMEQVKQAKQRQRWWRRLWRTVERTTSRIILRIPTNSYGIGRYDENRIAMYSSEMFQNTNYEIGGFGGQRTVHLGIDLGGPVGAKVYAFADGLVHSVGYNEEYGDYGYVIVLQHTLPSGQHIWALYGHLDKSTVRGLRPGMTVRKGAVIGRLGDCHENGGWEAPHVHFQLSMIPPETHDMPGASSVEDRPKALLQYPDPRFILGPIY